MNEHDLTRHLLAHAADIEPTADAEGLRRSMARVDRNRRIRTVGAAGSMVAIVTFGFMSLGGSDQATSDLDVRGEVPAPVPGGPDLVPGTVEKSSDGLLDAPAAEPTDELSDGPAAANSGAE